MTLEGRLTIDLGAIAGNWRALDRLSAPGVETAGVVKADAYGCGLATVGPVLAEAGARSFFVAQPREGAALRAALGAGPAIYVLGGFPLAPGDEAALYASEALRPVLNGPEQVAAWREAGIDEACALQLDTGMNRLGFETRELLTLAYPRRMVLVMSHLASSDTPEAEINATQRAEFIRMTETMPVPLSLAATGGTLLGPAYHFDMTRPGIGLYGGLPFAGASGAVTLEVPILQVRDIAPGEAVGYGESWRASRPSRIATISAGYADGLRRTLSNRGTAHVEGVPCPFAGRVSMDLIGLDVTDCPAARAGAMAELIGPHQPVDTLAQAAGTIGYEMLTSLGARYARRYRGA